MIKHYPHITVRTDDANLPVYPLKTLLINSMVASNEIMYFICSTN